jgi:ADP-ribose pyrophosphatase YjhB (NUDIX family)
LFREIKEETELEVEILSSKPSIQQNDTKFILTPRFVDVHEANPPHKHIALAYFARAKSSNYVLSDEHIEIRWLSLKDLDKSEYELSDSVKFYSKEALKASNSK